jgi:flagellar biogenesis protein FliO
MRAILIVAALAAPATADDAAPSFELRDRGDTVEVIAHNVKAARTAILPVRSRLEIPIVAGPLARRVVPGDPTVKLIELASDSAQQMLSVKLGYDKPEVKQLARFAQAIQVGDDLHVLVPRKLPADGVAPKLPEPSNMPSAAAVKAEAAARLSELAKAGEAAKAEPAKPAPAAPATPAPATPAPVTTELAKPVAPAAPVADVRPVAAVKPVDPPVLGPPAPAEAKPVEPPAAAKPVAAKVEPAKAEPAKAAPLQPQLAAPGDDGWSKISLYAVLGLAAAGAGVWLLRKKQRQLAVPSTIEVIAQRSLGGKARVVWLSAGQREMIVSVTAQQVQMLGQWAKPDAPPLDDAEPAGERADGPDLRGALLDKLHDRVAPRRQTATLEAQRRPTGSIPAQRAQTSSPAPRRTTGSIPAQRAATNAPVGAGPRRATGSLPVQPAEPALSPAVSGILRLRGRTGQMAAINPEVATGEVEADELWAREILAATSGRR